MKMRHKKDSEKAAGKIIALFILFLLLTSVSGCGTPHEEVAVPATEPIGAQNPPGEGQGDAEEKELPRESLADNQTEEPSKEQTDNQDGEPGSSSAGSQNDESGSSAPANNFAPQSDSELLGSVKTIGRDSFVVSQHFVMPLENSNEDLMVAPAEGSAEEVLITVHVTADTTWEIHTVKNGGINGDSDVEKQSGTFSDLQEGGSLDMKGYYEGGDFYAEEIVIHRFV